MRVSIWPVCDVSKSYNYLSTAAPTPDWLKVKYPPTWLHSVLFAAFCSEQACALTPECTGTLCTDNWIGDIS